MARWFRYAAVVLVAVVLAAAGAAGAGTTKTVELKIGDAVDVVGTKIACFAIRSNGRAGVACVLWKGSDPAVGSYGVGLAVDGTVSLNRIGRNGTATTIFKRRPAAAHRVYKLRVGDVFGLQITDEIALGCHVIDVTSTSVAPVYRGPKVSCWRATATAPLPATDGVSISDKMAGVFRFDAQGRVSKWGIMRRQP